MFSKTWCPYCQGAQARINQFLGEYKPPSTDKNGQPKVTPDEKQPYKVLELDFRMQLFPAQFSLFVQDLFANGFLFFSQGPVHAKSA